MPLPWPFISVPTGLTARTCTLFVYLFCQMAFFGFQSLVVPAHGSWEVPRNLHPSRAVPKRGLTGVGILVAKLLCHWVGKDKVHIYTAFQRSLVGLSTVTWWYSLTGGLLFPCSLSYAPTVRPLANILLTLTSLSLSLLLGKPDLKTACTADDNLMLHPLKYYYHQDFLRLSFETANPCQQRKKQNSEKSKLCSVEMAKYETQQNKRCFQPVFRAEILLSHTTAQPFLGRQSYTTILRERQQLNRVLLL